MNAKWARGHSARGEGGFAGDRPAPARVRPLPGPDDPLWDEPDGTVDLGELVPEDEPDSLDDAPVPPPAEQPADAGPARPPSPDPPPAHSRRQWRKEPKAPKGTGGPKGRPPRVAPATVRDIDAKIRFALQVPGTIWQARDPLCGGTFCEQIPDTAEAFTDIVCDSPDLIAFFTGPGGNFMKVLKLGAALMPVVSVVAAHHVYHTVEIDQGPVEAFPNYAA